MLTYRWESTPFGTSGWLSLEAFLKRDARLTMAKEAAAANAIPPTTPPTIAPTLAREMAPMLEEEEEFVGGEGEGKSEGKGEGSWRARRYAVGSLARDFSNIYRVRELA